MPKYILAHDLGTTGNKATLYDSDGVLVGSAFYGYGTEYAHPNWAEQNPEDWWRAVCVSTQALLQQTKIRPQEVAAVTFSGQMMGAVPLDRAARPLRNAIIWADQRAVPQERWLGERVDPAEVYRITGHRLSASYSLSKILWLRDNQPEVYAATYKFVHAKDAIVARLTGQFVTEPTDASGMNLYDLDAWDWSARIIEAAGLDADKLPALRRSIDVVGEILPQVAEEVGLPAGTPVVIGGGDGMCAAAGAGVVDEGAAYNYIGSSSWIALATRRPIYDPAYRTFTWAHLVPGMYSPCGTMQMAGGSYQWTRDQLGYQEKQAAQALGVSPYELLSLTAQQSPPGARGLIYLPYLLGERSPRWNPRARGAFIGLTVRHTRADMVRAVLEGVTMNLRVILEAFTSQGARIDAMRVIGGGARGRFWNQLMADIYGVPVQRLAILEEATSMGAALAGGIGVGLYRDFSMSQTMNAIAETFQPNLAAQAAYAKIYPIFEAAYHALLPIYDQIAEAGL
ncbi:MAG: xylulokinase [Anaerolineae bacterium]